MIRSIAVRSITSALLLVVDLTAIDRIVHWYSDAVDGGSFASILLMAELGDVAVWAPVWIVASGGVTLALAVGLHIARAAGVDAAVCACLRLCGCLRPDPGPVA